jgi:hypothetical protein
MLALTVGALAKDDLRGVMPRVHRVDHDNCAGEAGERFQQLAHRRDLVGLLVHGGLPEDRADAVRQRRDQVRAFPSLLFFVPRTDLPSMAITSLPPACTALVHSQAPGTRSSTSRLTRAKARRNVDSSAAPRAAPSTVSTSGPASAAHCPIAANDRDPAIPTASSPASA